MKELIETTLEEARQTLESFLEETTTVGIISQAASTCAEALKAGNKIISCCCFLKKALQRSPSLFQCCFNKLFHNS
jgi:phosphoheptose isomerase